MVDYTKPAMRDESWRRWKGGKKLADDLRVFYTNKRVFDRLGYKAASLSAGSAQPNGELTDRQRLRGHMINAFLNNRTTDRGSRVLGGTRLMSSAPAADLPGQSSPRR